ncbi:LacI family DNA-binding transcriptional regulator [uncultured Friedmanniella sp.]|uniref:LacI family DNA-binding transcriptional regulator n=1 Tax=uncultured Friedmanniella sp. TaxID=335381 RepID=UPI0035C9CE8C
MSPPRPATRLKDVAALAGVSVKTVSNVVNDFPYVRPATRAKVQSVLDELGYRPNLSARNLRSGRTGVIALAVPELEAPYFAELASQVVRAAIDVGWTVLIDETGGDRERERAVVAGIRGQLIDGVLLSPLALRESDLQQGASAVPLVLLGERLGPGLADHVAIDNEAAARELTEHLISSGRTRIAVVGSQRPPYGHTGQLRMAGYRAALAAAGLPYDPGLVMPVVQWRRGPGAEAVRALVRRDDPPDAIFCLNDLLAVGALFALAEEGISVPDQIAVVGFDDIEEGRYHRPALTTVAPDKAEIARQAVARLAQRLSPGPDSQAPPEEVTVGHRLLVRGSTSG